MTSLGNPGERSIVGHNVERGSILCLFPARGNYCESQTSFTHWSTLVVIAVSPAELWERLVGSLSPHCPGPLVVLCEKVLVGNEHGQY
jgi:hypothetical protein